MASAIVSALIAGVFTLLGVLLDHRLSSRSVVTTSGTVTQTVTGTTQPPASVSQTVITSSQTVERFSIGKVLIQVGVLQLVLNLVGFIIGFAYGAAGIVDPAAYIGAILIVGTIIAIIGFAIIGRRVSKTFRWKHLIYVAIGVSITTLVINSLFLQITTAAIIFAFIQTFFAMGIGGVIANAMK